MSAYQHFLLACDLAQDSRQVAERAQALAARSDAMLSMVHVLGAVPPAVSGEFAASPAMGDLYREAEEQMHSLAANYGIPPERCHLLTDHKGKAIACLAEEIGADLVVLGYHPRQGLAKLLSTTAEGVLRKAGRDVLTVHIRPEDSA